MIHFKPVNARVLIKGDDKERLNQYEQKFDCRVVSEVFHFPNHSLERIYSFHTRAQKKAFLSGLFSDAKIL